MHTLKYGTSSWSEKGWIGPFYPPKTEARDMLAFYSRQFPAVEADVTYYRIPSRKMVQDWVDRTSDHFIIAAKFPREIVHGGTGKTPDAAKVLNWSAIESTVVSFLEVMRLLGPKCGPLVIQCPYYNKSVFPSCEVFLERLNWFLSQLPRDFKYGVEIRNRAWLSSGLLDILSTYGVSLIWADIPYMPYPWNCSEVVTRQTAPFLYVRLIGDRNATNALTDTFSDIVIDRTAELHAWANYVVRIASQYEEIFVFANNHFAGHGPATIQEFVELVTQQGAGVAS